MTEGRHERLAAVNTIAVKLAEAATENTGVTIPEDKLSRMTALAESMLPENIMEVIDKAAGAEAVARELAAAAQILKEEEERVRSNTDKHGGAVMESLLKKREKDFVDDVNAAGDKIAAVQGDVAGTEVRMMHIEKDPIGSVAVVFEKLAAISEDLVKLAEATEVLQGQVAEIVSKDNPEADAKVPDASAKDEGADTSVIAEGKDTGMSVMTGDPSGKKSAPTNPAVAGAGGVSANPKTAVGDVIARAAKAEANIKNVLATLKNTAGK